MCSMSAMSFYEQYPWSYYTHIHTYTRLAQSGAVKIVYTMWKHIIWWLFIMNIFISVCAHSMLPLARVVCSKSGIWKRGWECEFEYVYNFVLHFIKCPSWCMVGPYAFNKISVLIIHAVAINDIKTLSWCIHDNINNNNNNSDINGDNMMMAMTTTLSPNKLT